MNDSKTAVTANRQILGDLGILSSAMIWGSSYSILKIGLSNFPVFMLLSMRFGLAALLLAVVFRKRLAHLTKKCFFTGLGIGFCLFCAFAFFSIGIRQTEASRAGFIVGLLVVIVPILNAVISGKLPGKGVMAGVSLVTVGLAFLSLKNMAFSGGDVLILVAAFFYAAHIVVTGKYAGAHDSSMLVTVQLALGSLLFGFISLFSEDHAVVLSAATLWPILYLAVMASAVALLIQTKSQALTPANHAAVIYTSEPVFGAVFAYFFLGETMGTSEVIGALMIVGGMLAVEWGKIFPRSGRQNG